MATVVKPVEDRILVLPDPNTETTASGIFIPEVVRKKTRSGIVMATGPGRRSERDGRHIPHDVNPGDRVFFTEYAGAAVYVDGTEHFMLRAEECLAKENS
jgi:chaperonin GroES